MRVILKTNDGKTIEICDRFAYGSLFIRGVLECHEGERDDETQIVPVPVNFKEVQKCNNYYISHQLPNEKTHSKELNSIYRRTPLTPFEENFISLKNQEDAMTVFELIKAANMLDCKEVSVMLAKIMGCFIRNLSAAEQNKLLKKDTEEQPDGEAAPMEQSADEGGAAPVQPPANEGGVVPSNS